MKHYLRIHLVEAEPMTRGDYNKRRGWELPAGENPADEGYLVVYPDGYKSWCPKEAFERAGFPLERDDKITPEDVGEFISRGTESFEKIGEKTTLVKRRYSTGIEDFAHSSCVSPENFDLDIGAKIAAEKLDDCIWMFLGWALAWAKNGVNVKAPAEPAG